MCSVDIFEKDASYYDAVTETIVFVPVTDTAKILSTLAVVIAGYEMNSPKT